MDVLLEQGAVLYCKTNVPQTLMVSCRLSWESTWLPSLLNPTRYTGTRLLKKTTHDQTGDSHNHVFGRTLNPFNTSLTAGGSSGGEGALVAFRGSPLGVGTDVAGTPIYPSNPPCP